MHNKNMSSNEDDAPATKGDIRKLEQDIKSIKSDLAACAKKDDLVREIAVSSTRLELKMDTWAERIEANNEKFRSQMTTWVTAFLAKVEGISNGEKILVHRVEGLESRVSSLEARQTP